MCVLCVCAVTTDFSEQDTKPLSGACSVSLLASFTSVSEAMRTHTVRSFNVIAVFMADIYGFEP